MLRHGAVGVPDLATGVGGPDLLHMLGHHIRVEQVVAAVGIDHGMLHGVPLSMVVPGPELLVIIQLLVGLHGVVGLGVRLRCVFSVQYSTTVIWEWLLYTLF
jgi:hypothetical protein